MKQSLNILHLEDDPSDAELVQTVLAREGIECEVVVVDKEMDFVALLEQGNIDLILADFALPEFDGMSALSIVREKYPQIPFVFVSGRLGEEAAIESLKSGATDYVLKNRLSRLVPAVKRAISEAMERLELKAAEEELAKAYCEIKERAESYHNLFCTIRDVIMVADQERMILQINQPALRETFGYELDEVVGRSTRMLYADEDEYLRMGREIFDHRVPVKGRTLEIRFRRKNGDVFLGEMAGMKRLDSQGGVIGNLGIIRDITERKRAEEALRESEMRRYQLQVELVYAAEIQAKLLPRDFPHIPGFDIAGQCIPAKQVGGDFFDWQEVCPGVWSLILGDVMGKGMAAAMLMATVRATIRAVGHNPPAEALRLVESAVLQDLENSESFVTLFLGQLNTEERSLNFVDCGHGYVFVRRNSGQVKELSPRGLPLGVTSGKGFRAGRIRLEPGDTLVLYSDGLIDARPELGLNHRLLARQLEGATSAREMLDRMVVLTEQKDPLPDDVTVLVLHCTG